MLSLARGCAGWFMLGEVLSLGFFILGGVGGGANVGAFFVVYYLLLVVLLFMLRDFALVWLGHGAAGAVFSGLWGQCSLVWRSLLACGWYLMGGGSSY